MPAVPLAEKVYSQWIKDQVRNAEGRKQSVGAGAGQSPYVSVHATPQGWALAKKATAYFASLHNNGLR